MHISRLSELGYYREAFRSSEALRRPAVLHWRRCDLDHDFLHLPIWIVNRSVLLDPTCERALFRCTVVEAAAVEFAAFLQVSCGLSLYGFQGLRN